MKITVTGASELKLPAECAVVSLTVSLTGTDRADIVARTAAIVDRAAHADATTRATWIAEAAGFTTVTVASVQDNGRQAYRGAGKAAMFMDMGGSVPSIRLDPEDVDVSADLTIRFRAS